MDFAVIGKLHSYVQQKNFKFATEFKKKTGQAIINSNGNLQLELKKQNNQSLVDKMIQAQQSSRDENSNKRVSSIKQKLLSGRKISTEELGYLKENAPDLYKKAKKVEETREELKVALKNAKSKSEAQKAVTQALIKASADATAEIESAKLGVSANAINVNNTNQNINLNENVNLNVPNNSINEDNSPSNLVEKFIMIVRGIEDEYSDFAKSDDYKNLAGDEFEKQKIKPLNHQVLKTLKAYNKK